MEASPDETFASPDAIGAAPLPERAAVKSPRRGADRPRGRLRLLVADALRRPRGAAVLVLKTRSSAGLGDEMAVLPGGLAFEASRSSSPASSRRAGAARFGPSA